MGDKKRRGERRRRRDPGGRWAAKSSRGRKPQEADVAPQTSGERRSSSSQCPSFIFETWSERGAVEELDLWEEMDLTEGTDEDGLTTFVDDNYN